MNWDVLDFQISRNNLLKWYLIIIWLLEWFCFMCCVLLSDMYHLIIFLLAVATLKFIRKWIYMAQFMFLVLLPYISTVMIDRNRLDVSNAEWVTMQQIKGMVCFIPRVSHQHHERVDCRTVTTPPKSSPYFSTHDNYSFTHYIQLFPLKSF